MPSSEYDESDNLFSFQSMASSSSHTSIPSVPTSPLEEKLGYKKHDKYYFEDGSILLLVDGVLYNVHRTLLERQSPWFRKLFKVSKKKLASGWEPHLPPFGDKFYVHHGFGHVSYDAPTVIDPFTGAITLENGLGAAFDAFLAVLYPNDYDQHDLATLSEWAAVLRRAHEWSCPSIQSLAIRHLEPLLVSLPLDRLVLARDCKVSRWVVPAIRGLCLRDHRLYKEEMRRMAYSDIDLVNALREGILSQSIEPGTLNDSIYALVRESALHHGRLSPEEAEAQQKAREARARRVREEIKRREERLARLHREHEAQREERARQEEERRRREVQEADREAREAEEARIAEEERQAEEARLAEERRVEEARAEAALLAEQARIAEEARRVKEARIAEELRLAEVARLAEEARIAEMVRLASIAERERHAAEERRVRERQAMQAQGGQWQGIGKSAVWTSASRPDDLKIDTGAMARAASTSEKSLFSSLFTGAASLFTSIANDTEHVFPGAEKPLAGGFPGGSLPYGAKADAAKGASVEDTGPQDPLKTAVAPGPEAESSASNVREPKHTPSDGPAGTSGAPRDEKTTGVDGDVEAADDKTAGTQSLEDSETKVESDAEDEGEDDACVSPETVTGNQPGNEQDVDAKAGADSAAKRNKGGRKKKRGPR